MSFPKKYLTTRPLLAALAIATTFIQVSCRGEWEFFLGDHDKMETRQELAPAATAEEWIERMKMDLQPHSYSSAGILTYLYAELPPMNQWPAVCDGIEKIANDQAALAKLMRGRYSFKTPAEVAPRLLLFSAMLRDDATGREPAVREILGTTDDDDYQRAEKLRLLLLSSEDHQETLLWLEETKFPVLKKSSSPHSSSNDEKPAWKAAFAENKVKEGIALLEKEITQAEPADKPDLLHTLLKLGIVLGNDELAKKATTEFQENLLKRVPGDDSLSRYTYEDVFDFQAASEDWKGIVDFFEEYIALNRKHHTEPSSYDFGQNDEAFATYLTALSRLGETEKFRTLTEKALAGTEKDREDFVQLMEHAAPGQPPLGILYMDSLKAAGDSEKALTYSLNLLARSRGTDAFYEYLIGLDQVRAKEFITSLSAYDPYEERPLIWLAEIARRSGDIQLAQTIIAEAIALDPSDGDHGEDTRMFCYEVLARIHEDSGRAEEAKKFRSIVDSIRQGEAADDFLHAGLIREATDRYKRALGQFEDAYCLQSRLAMTLARNGNFEEATEHFRKAFELMPVSFGPRESQCFGCEGIFSDERVIEIALPLLQAFEKENPENARVPYLLGLILSERDDFPQAALAYGRALELDPGYYNAGLKLLDILEKDPKDFVAAQELRAQMFATAPYPEKPKYIPNPQHLRAYWELSGKFPPSPLNLPPLAPVSGDNKEQYTQGRDINYYSSAFDSNEDKALDGWSPSELRRGNEFLCTLERID